MLRRDLNNLLRHDRVDLSTIFAGEIPRRCSVGEALMNRLAKIKFPLEENPNE